MSSKSRSINQKLKRADTLERKEKVLLEWAEAWKIEQMDLISKFEKAIKNNDYDELCITTAFLKESAIKKFDALPNVLINTLCCKIKNVNNNTNK